MEVRVIRSDPAPYGRFRVGCEITELDEDSHAVIDEVANSAPSGSEAERSPERLKARERMLGRDQGLSSRIRDDE
jgi:hypothetical protein